MLNKLELHIKAQQYEHTKSHIKTLEYQSYSQNFTLELICKVCII